MPDREFYEKIAMASDADEVERIFSESGVKAEYAEGAGGMPEEEPVADESPTMGAPESDMDDGVPYGDDSDMAPERGRRGAILMAIQKHKGGKDKDMGEEEEE